nr:MAG TPA_asm: hypothetical protein [Caudoviricetes sp.]
MFLVALMNSLAIASIPLSVGSKTIFGISLPCFVKFHYCKYCIVGKVKQRVFHSLTFYLRLVLHKRLHALQFLCQVPVGVCHATLLEQLRKAIAVVVVLRLEGFKHLVCDSFVCLTRIMKGIPLLIYQISKSFCRHSTEIVNKVFRNNMRKVNFCRRIAFPFFHHFFYSYATFLLQNIQRNIHVCPAINITTNTVVLYGFYTKSLCWFTQSQIAVLTCIDKIKKHIFMTFNTLTREKKLQPNINIFFLNHKLFLLILNFNKISNTQTSLVDAITYPTHKVCQVLISAFIHPFQIARIADRR